MCVDCGLTYLEETSDVVLRPAAASGTGVSFLADSAVFSVGDVGKFIRIGGGKAEITAYVGTREVTCSIIRPITDLIKPSGRPRPLAGWSMSTAVTSVSGLWHLEGEAVSVLADGEVIPGKTVALGQVTGIPAASVIHVGLGFQVKVKTLPITIAELLIEGKRRQIKSVDYRVNKARGLLIGADEDSLFDTKVKTTEAYNVATALQTGTDEHILINSFDREGQMVFVVNDPLPMTLLGYRLNVDVGDDDKD